MGNVKVLVIDDVKITAPIDMEELEIRHYLKEEIDLWKGRDKQLGSIELIVTGSYVDIKSKEKSPIKRVRRITGYLSSLENFGDAKKAEAQSRVAHVTI